MLQALFGFGLSFVFTWAMKWVVAAFVLGWDEVFSNVLGEMGLLVCAWDFVTVAPG